MKSPVDNYLSTMNVQHINDIEDLIHLSPGKKILWHEVKRLTAPGENYGSLMLSVDLTVASKDGTEKIYTVAKMVPPNEFIQHIFNTQVTFRNEIAFYRNIVPALQEFQRENGVEKLIDFSARYYGGRLNLNDGKGRVDSDAALVLENLKVAGYVTLERTQGLDFDATKLILTNLAQLHGVSLALKLKKPEVFENEIKPHLSPWTVEADLHNNMVKDITRVIDETEKLEPLKDRILDAFSKQLIEQEPREPFATITHNDCWTNNNMFKLDENKPVKCIMVDYQVCSYGSPARDLIFFLFSSVKNCIIEKQYEELINFYHENFLATLQEFHCDTTSFGFEALQNELDFEAMNSQIPHVLFMLFPIFAHNDQVKDISELTPESLAVQEISDLHKEKFAFVIDQFIKRNWL